MIKRHLGSAWDKDSKVSGKESNLRVHLYQPRDASPGCQRVDWRHHLCVDGNTVVGKKSFSLCRCF